MIFFVISINLDSEVRPIHKEVVESVYLVLDIFQRIRLGYDSEEKNKFAQKN